VRYHGKNVHDVLEMTVREALAFFVNVPKVVSKAAGVERDWAWLFAVGAVGHDSVWREAAALEARAHLTRSEIKASLYLDEPQPGFTLRHRETLARSPVAGVWRVAAGD